MLLSLTLDDDLLAQGTIQDILGGLRSACTYVGASSLKEVSKRTTFIRCTQQLNPVFSNTRDESKLPASYFTKLNSGSGSDDAGQKRLKPTEGP